MCVCVCGGGRGGGGTLNTTKTTLHILDLCVRKPSLPQIDINLETRRNGSKSGHYSPTSGDREIRFKIWILPDYTGELTALLPASELIFFFFFFFFFYLGHFNIFNFTCVFLEKKTFLRWFSPPLRQIKCRFILNQSTLSNEIGESPAKTPLS